MVRSRYVWFTANRVMSFTRACGREAKTDALDAVESCLVTGQVRPRSGPSLTDEHGREALKELLSRLQGRWPLSEQRTLSTDWTRVCLPGFAQSRRAPHPMVGWGYRAWGDGSTLTH